LRFEDRARHDIFRRDEFNLVLLAAEFPGYRACKFRVGLVQTVAEKAGLTLPRSRLLHRCHSRPLQPCGHTGCRHPVMQDFSAAHNPPVPATAAQSGGAIERPVF
jgi:hypothetical protein